MWARIRRIWAICGTIAFVVFTTWALIAFRASGAARAALKGTERVSVARGDGHWRFEPNTDREPGLVFFAGALVDPAAYAPLLLEIAAAGFPALLIELPRRGAFGGADGPEVLARAGAAMAAITDVSRWVVAGHSKGGAVAARFVRAGTDRVAGLVLIGTSHPRDFSLADVTMPVVQVYGTRDTVADEEKVVDARRNLPAGTRFVRIDGGNHSQFGSYGFQPGDWPAAISREQQHRLTRDSMLALLSDLTPSDAREAR